MFVVSGGRFSSGRREETSGDQNWMMAFLSYRVTRANICIEPKAHCCVSHTEPCFQLGAVDPRATPSPAAVAALRLLPSAVVNTHGVNRMAVENRYTMEVAADVHHNKILAFA